ncbi:hypothetical protein ANANG_G00201090 [Anguilla anguilla]|uniref:COMM domain-containing protein n=1 Tax=Anguilla anguilla TaxID=7936 RepID=A0A9D3LXX6_ANGAN|nr:hypothetical protein ANANG_G00201090 [Anguilla anguilla]
MDTIPEEHFASLQLLLKAPSKDAVRQLCQDSFPSGAPESQRLAESAAGTLSVSASEAQQLLRALHTLSHHVLFHGLTGPEQITGLFPDTFHTSLKNLLTKILLEHSPTWRNDALSSQISLPQLVDMDWRVVDPLKTPWYGPWSVSRMAVPTCLVHLNTPWAPGPPWAFRSVSVTPDLCLQRVTFDLHPPVPRALQVQDPLALGGGDSVSAVTVELSRETLDTMLDGLGRIRDQLSMVASK